MSSPLILLLSPLLLAGAAFAQPLEACTAEITARIDEADALKSSGELPRALARCAKILADAPNCPEAHMLRGNIYWNWDNWEEAKNSYAQAVRLNPGLVDAYVGLADVADEQDDPAEALRHLETAISLDPDNYDARWLRSWINMEAENYAAVEEDTSRLVLLNPGSVCVLERHGKALMRQQKTREAEPVYREILSIEPKNSRAWVSLFGSVAYQGDRDKDAMTIFEDGMSNIDKPETLLVMSSHWHYRNERYAEAFTNAKDALDIDSDYAVAWQELGNVYYVLDDFDQAVTAYSKSLALDPGDSECLRSRCHAAYQGEFYFLASLDARQLLLQNPVDWWASYIVARGLSWRDKNKEALPFITDALRLQPEDEHVLDDYGYILYELGDPHGALATFTRSLELHPDNDYAREWVADLQRELHRPTLTLPELDASPLSLLGYALAVLSIVGIVRTVMLSRVG